MYGLSLACWLGLTTSVCTSAGKMTRTTISATTQPPMPYSGQRQRRRQNPLAMSSAPSAKPMTIMMRMPGSPAWMSV